MSALWLLIGLQAVGFLVAAGLYLEATREKSPEELPLWTDPIIEEGGTPTWTERVP